MLGRRKARHIVHVDGFLGLARSRKRSIQASLLNSWFGDGIGSA